MTVQVARCCRVLGVLLAGAPVIAAAQVGPLPAPPARAVAFPPAASVLIGFSSYGARAGSTDSAGSTYTYTLSRGPILTGRLQSPLGRRFGLHLSGAFTYRSRREDRDGSPLSTTNDRVPSVRVDGGLLFRFKPAAPVFLGGSLVYVRHGAPPVLNQSGGVMTETGGGFGIGYDFGQKPGSNVAGRIEYWSYWVRPKADGLSGGYIPRTRARDGALTIGVTYHLRIRERPGR
ncbi:MAG: hypothetical protein Q8Q85_15365 [Gemmatimonadales bacterium]|nr:hypothetical protein [Gemmatimonadales bacterium]